MPQQPEISRAERLRQRAALERQKVQELDRLLARVEAHLTGSAGRGGAAAERRTFDRKAADLAIRYRWPGHLTPCIGRVQDISRGGLRFLASRQLRIGEVLEASLHAPRGALGPDIGGQMYLEVVHCRRAEEVWQVGARFALLPASKFDASERRKARRYPVRLEVRFRSAGGAAGGERGEALDISSGGLRFRAGRPLTVGTLAAVTIATSAAVEGAAGTRITLNSLVRVVRCRRLGARYDIGAQFVGLP